MLRETELFVAPDYFRVFAREHDALVSLHPKQTNAPNEMSRYRYDAVLRKVAKLEPHPLRMVQWKEIDGETALGELLRGQDVLRICGIPNALTQPAVEAWRRYLELSPNAPDRKTVESRIQSHGG